MKKIVITESQLKILIYELSNSKEDFERENLLPDRRPIITPTYFVDLVGKSEYQQFVDNLLTLKIIYKKMVLNAWQNAGPDQKQEFVGVMNHLRELIEYYSGLPVDLK